MTSRSPVGSRGPDLGCAFSPNFGSEPESPTPLVARQQVRLHVHVRRDAHDPRTSNWPKVAEVRAHAVAVNRQHVAERRARLALALLLS